MNSSEREVVWLAHLLFTRENRSIKDMMILQELEQWDDIKARVGRSWQMMLVHCIAIVFNFVMFGMSLARRRHGFYRNLALTNLILALGFLLCTFLIDVYYDVDSLDTLVMVNGRSNYRHVWVIAERILNEKLINGFIYCQSLIMFAISVDRYCALFPNYSPFVKKPFLFFLIQLVPYFIALVALDEVVLLSVFSKPNTNMIRLLFLLTPTLLGLIFSSCSVARLVQDSYSSNPNHDLSCSICLLGLLLLQLLEKFGFFLELLHSSFHIQIVLSNNPRDNQQLNAVLATYYNISHYIVMVSPLCQALVFMFGMEIYRKRMSRVGEKMVGLCKRKPRLNYNSETMRSIIAEQQRNRHMRRATFDRA